MTRGGRVGLVLVGGLGLAWGFSLLAGYDVVADVSPARADLGSSASAWLGTDHLGRDVAWRLLTASEAFVGPGALAAATAACLGVPLGAVAGYGGGTLGALVRAPLAVVASIPRLVLALLVGTIYGGDLRSLAVATGLAYAPALAEAVYARIHALHQAEFVIAARAHGLSESAILGRHLLWVSCRRLVARHLVYVFAFFLVLETTLSYIGGFGVSEPQPSWGNMLAFSLGRIGNPWASLAPALALWATVWGLVLLAGSLVEGDRVER